MFTVNRSWQHWLHWANWAWSSGNSWVGNWKSPRLGRRSDFWHHGTGYGRDGTSISRSKFFGHGIQNDIVSLYHRIFGQCNLTSYFLIRHTKSIKEENNANETKCQMKILIMPWICHILMIRKIACIHLRWKIRVVFPQDIMETEEVNMMEEVEVMTDYHW